MEETQSIESRINDLLVRAGHWPAVLKNIAAVTRAKGVFRISEIHGLIYADADYLMKIGIITFDKTRGTFTLALPVEDLERIINVGRAGTVEELQEGAVTNDASARFIDLINSEGDMLEYWAPQINPKVEGLLHVKKAILLSISSHGDVEGDCGRIHVLMKGDPGSAKTSLTGWLVYRMGAIGCSQRTTQVGLTGDARGNEITPGAAPRAHKGVLCVDELDKFPNKDRQGLLEPMAEGIVTITAGGMEKTFDAECRVIGCANSVEEFSPELLDRFDFIFDMKRPTGEEEKKVVSSILKHWFSGKPGYHGVDLKEYLNWIGDFEPGMDQPTREKADVLMQMLIDFDDKAVGSIRRRESIIRVAYTIAKLNRRSVVIGDFLRAIKMLHPDMSDNKIRAMQHLIDHADEFLNVARKERE